MIPAQHKTRSLLSTPQRLGILPTWWFWREVQRDPRLRVFLVVLSLLGPLPLGVVLGMTLPIVPAVIASVALGLLWEGALVRLLRQEALRRRLLRHDEALAQLHDARDGRAKNGA